MSPPASTSGDNKVPEEFLLSLLDSESQQSSDGVDAKLLETKKKIV